MRECSARYHEKLASVAETTTVVRGLILPNTLAHCLIPQWVQRRIDIDAWQFVL